MPGTDPVIEVHLRRFALVLVVRAATPEQLRVVRLQLSRLPLFTEYRPGIYGVHLVGLKQLRDLLGPFLQFRCTEQELAEAIAQFRLEYARRLAERQGQSGTGQGAGRSPQGSPPSPSASAQPQRPDELLPPNILHTLATNGDDVLRPPGLKESTEPRHYQTLAQEWLVTAKGPHSVIGGLCADQTGLGKTLEAILACLRLRATGFADGILWVTQPHLIIQTAMEWSENTDCPYTLVTSSMSPKKRRQVYESWDTPVLILSYSMLRNDIGILRRLRRISVVVLDEAAIIRTFNKTFKAVRRLSPKAWIQLTATPMQNGPQDVYPLFQLLNPAILGDWRAFKDRYLITRVKFGREMIVGYRKDRLPELHRTIAPYILRRRTEDVTDEIPDVVEQFEFVPMTPEQQQAHDHFQEELFTHSEVMDTTEDEKEFRRSFTEYRRRFGILSRVATHPVLMLTSSSPLVQQYLEEHPLTDLTSPKVEALKSRLREIILGSGDFAVVFTESERLARRVQEELAELFAEPEFRRLAHLPQAVLWTGKMDKSCQALERGMQMNCHTCPFAGECASREKSKWLFMNDDSARVIIVVTKAGETGLNLQRGKYLFNLELSWNPGVVEQQIGRIRRLKSPHDRIFVIHFVAKDSIEETIVRVVYKKRRMSEMVVENTAEEQEQLVQAMTEVYRIMRQSMAARRRSARSRSRAARSGAAESSAGGESRKSRTSGRRPAS